MEAVSGQPLLKSGITSTFFNFSWNIPDLKDLFKILESRLDISGDKDFRIFIGMLFGYRDFSVIRGRIISFNLEVTDGALKTNFNSELHQRLIRPWYIFDIIMRNMCKIFVKDVRHNYWAC